MTEETAKAKVELLVCKCRSCTHWEIGRDETGQGFILCKTCDETLPVAFNVELHDGVHWEPHAR